MTFDSEAEAQFVIDSLDEGNFEVSPLGNPIDEAMNRADMGDLDQSRGDIQEAFEEAYTEEMQRLENMQVICTIVNLDGTYAKSEWPELYESVATWLELGGDPQVILQMMSGQEPEHKRTDRVKVTDYLGLYKDPVVIDYPDPNDLDNWKPVGVGDTTSKGEVVSPWLDTGFDIGTVVTVSQDFGGDYVVIIPPSNPNTFVGGLLLLGKAHNFNNFIWFSIMFKNPTCGTTGDIISYHVKTKYQLSSPMFWEKTIDYFDNLLFVGISIPQTTQNSHNTNGTCSVEYIYLVRTKTFCTQCRTF